MITIGIIADVLLFCIVCILAAIHTSLEKQAQLLDGERFVRDYLKRVRGTTEIHTNLQ